MCCCGGPRGQALHQRKAIIAGTGAPQSLPRTRPHNPPRLMPGSCGESDGVHRRRGAVLWRRRRTIAEAPAPRSDAAKVLVTTRHGSRTWRGRAGASGPRCSSTSPHDSLRRDGGHRDRLPPNLCCRSLRPRAARLPDVGRHPQAAGADRAVQPSPSRGDHPAGESSRKRQVQSAPMAIFSATLRGGRHLYGSAPRCLPHHGRSLRRDKNVFASSPRNSR